MSDKKIHYAKLPKTPGFTDEYHDIYDPETYGRRTLELRFSSKNKASKKMQVNSFSTSWVSGLGCMMLYEVFPCPKFIMVCTLNYDDNKRVIVNKDSKEELLSINAKKLEKCWPWGLQLKNLEMFTLT